MINPFECEGRWFKANLHTHTLLSDGKASVEQRIEQYRQKGYDILAITDHLTSGAAKGRSSEDFLVINGIEIHPPNPYYAAEPYHLVGLNVPDGFEPDEELQADAQIKQIRRAGGEVVFAHPYWSGHNINELLAVNGYIAVEVYNAGATKIGKAFGSVLWDELLEAGRIVGGVAVDDVHEGRDIFMGWTCIRAKELAIEAVMDSLRMGCCYATCGPVIEDFRVAGGVVSIKCSPAAEVHFMAQRRHGFSFYADGGKLIQQAQFDLYDEMQYVRAEIVDEKGNHAWTNPIML